MLTRLEGEHPIVKVIRHIPKHPFATLALQKFTIPLLNLYPESAHPSSK